MQLETNYKEMPLSNALALSRRAVGDMRAENEVQNCVVLLTYHMSSSETLRLRVYIVPNGKIIEELIT